MNSHCQMSPRVLDQKPRVLDQKSRVLDQKPEKKINRYIYISENVYSGMANE